MQGEGQTGTLHLLVASCYHHHDCYLHCGFPWVQWFHQGFVHVQSRKPATCSVWFDHFYYLANTGHLVRISVLQNFQGEIDFDQGSLMNEQMNNDRLFILLHIILTLV